MVSISALAWPRFSRSSNSGRAASPNSDRNSPRAARRVHRVDVGIDRDDRAGRARVSMSATSRPTRPKPMIDRARVLASRLDVRLAGSAPLLDPARGDRGRAGRAAASGSGRSRSRSARKPRSRRRSARRRRRAEHDQGGLRGRGHQQAGFGGDRPRVPRRAAADRGHHRLDDHHADHRRRELRPVAR